MSTTKYNIFITINSPFHAQLKIDDNKLQHNKTNLHCSIKKSMIYRSINIFF